MYVSHALDLLNFSYEWIEFTRCTILDSYLTTTGRLQFRRKVQLYYVVSQLPTCGSYVDVQTFASSWQTAYKIHWSAIINSQRLSSAVYFDQIDRFANKRPEIDKVLLELSFHWSIKLRLMNINEYPSFSPLYLCL
jgi:hypothetical protein